MTRTLFILPVIINLIFIVGCGTKKQDANGDHHEHEATNEDWKEMDEFHMVMAEAFHPYKDSANLAPAKQLADSLVTAAEKWAAAPLPEKFKEDDEVKFKLNQLKTDASTFATVARTGDEKAIGESLTKLHDLFHEIMESWHGGHGEHH
jgi:hypothetical protein